MTMPDNQNSSDWVMVPRVPTQAMIDAGKIAYDYTYGGHRNAKRIYAAMLAAAPAPAMLNGVEAGIEVAAKWVEARRDAFCEEYGRVDPSTNAMEFGRGAHAEAKEAYVGDLEEIIEGIRALRAADNRDAAGVAITREMWEWGISAYAEWVRQAYSKGVPTPEVRTEGCDIAIAAMRAAAPTVAPNGNLVGWWNGITPDVTERSPYGPSVRWGADAEDRAHDIPLYDGYNPIHYVTPTAAPAGVDRAAYEGAREDLLDWKGRAQRAEAELRRLGYAGIDASEPPTHTAAPAGEAVRWEVRHRFHDGAPWGPWETFDSERAMRNSLIPYEDSDWKHETRALFTHPPAAEVREVDALRPYALRNLRKLIEAGSTDKALMLTNLDELE